MLSAASKRLWRHAIVASTQCLELEKQEAEEVKSSSSLRCNGPLVERILNPAVLKSCLELLSELRQGLETDGFNEERDISILEKIYGEPDERYSRETLYETYLTWLITAKVSEEERQREKYETPEQCKQNMLSAIDREPGYLKNRQKARIDRIQEIRLEILRRSVPDSSGLDRLLRYEASLERSFDRTLSQLERQQRMRRGQPVAPRIDVNVSA